MNSSQHPASSWWKRALLFTLLALVVSWLGYSAWESKQQDSFASVGLTGVQHIGPNFNVSSFYVDGYYGSNVGRGGGGGSDVCCVLLPKLWRPDLTVELRWKVGDWSKENRSEIDAENYSSITFQDFKARVPVEKYDRPAQIYVHFYADGKARVVSSGVGSRNPKHPILVDDLHADISATAGTPVLALFSEDELSALRRKDEERKKKNGGDWR